MTEPTTAAGRRFYYGNAVKGFEHKLLADILAIEAEMYDLASNEGYHAGIADCKEHDLAHAEARQQDGSALREVLERLVGAVEQSEPMKAGVVGHGLASIRINARAGRAALAALPPSAPPVLDREYMRGYLAGRDECAELMDVKNRRLAELEGAPPHARLEPDR